MRPWPEAGRAGTVQTLAIRIAPNGRLPKTLRLASARRNVAEVERTPARNEARGAQGYKATSAGRLVRREYLRVADNQ